MLLGQESKIGIQIVFPRVALLETILLVSLRKLRYFIQWSNLTGLDWNEILVAGTKGEEKGVDKSQVEG